MYLYSSIFGKVLKCASDRVWHNIKPVSPHVNIFVHIPKAGGTTLTGLWQQCFNHYRHLRPTLIGRRDKDGRAKNIESNDPDIVSLRSGLIFRKKTLEAVSGHLPFGIHRYLDRPCRYFTVFREPLDRALSQYKHATRQPDSALGNIFQSYDNNLVAMIEDRAALQFMNDQTRFITGTRKVDLDNDDFCEAVEILKEYFVFWGVLEQFDDVFKRMKMLLGFKSTCVRKLNTSSSFQAHMRLNPKEKKILEEANTVDIKLYDWVRQNCCARFKE